MKTIKEIFDRIINTKSENSCIDIYSVLAIEFFELDCTSREVREKYPEKRSFVKQALYLEMYS